jgi:RES domain-containing protein
VSDTVRAWRIVKRRRVAAVTTGEGARIHGGRWTPPGVPAAYASLSLSLALLEVLVNLDAPALIRRYVYFTLDIPARPIHTLDPSHLPDDWRASPPSESSQLLGKRWIDAGKSVALRVPSAVLPVEFNLVLNPAHAGFKDIAVSGPFELDADARVWSR